MAYGTFNKSVGYGYSSYTYTESGTSYTVHIYKTNPQTMGIAGAVYSTEQFLSKMNPNSNVCTPSKVLAKTNANYLDPGGPKAFYGIFYSGGEFSFDGQVGIDPGSSDLSGVYYDANFFRAPPAMCINSQTKTATIRWPNYYGGTNRLTPKQLTQLYDVIISGQHCLVHAGKSVFETTCYSHEGITIANWSSLSNKYNHHNELLGSGNSKTKRARTFFGHSSTGACYLVCVVGDHDYGDNGEKALGMDLKVGARLMCDLGCDYALNMDGGSPTQMRVSGTDVYSTSGTDGYKIGSAICAYSK